MSVTMAPCRSPLDCVRLLQLTPVCSYTSGAGVFSPDCKPSFGLIQDKLGFLGFTQPWKNKSTFSRRFFWMERSFKCSFFCGPDALQGTREASGVGVHGAHTKYTHPLTSQTHSKHNVHASLFTLAQIVSAWSGEGKHGQSVRKAVCFVWVAGALLGPVHCLHSGNKCNRIQMWACRSVTLRSTADQQRDT